MVEPTGKVHPVAALFPMMTEDELDDLAADIRANGLLQAVVLDIEGTIIDGRNRLAACKRANVRPQYTLLNGHEPVAFIIASNVARRHLTKGQQAMAIAMSGNIGKISDPTAPSADRVNRAKMVLKWAAELATDVLAGAVKLDDAHETARQRKALADSGEKKLAVLQKKAPDLADLVVEERLTLEEARAALEKRTREERDYVALVTRQFSAALTALDPGSVAIDESARTWLKADAGLVGEAGDFSAERARRIAAVLARYAELKEE
jgi:hypothetical protein